MARLAIPRKGPLIRVESQWRMVSESGTQIIGPCLDLNLQLHVFKHFHWFQAYGLCIYGSRSHDFVINVKIIYKYVLLSIYLIIIPHVWCRIFVYAVEIRYANVSVRGVLVFTVGLWRSGRWPSSEGVVRANIKGRAEGTLGRQSTRAQSTRPFYSIRVVGRLV